MQVQSSSTSPFQSLFQHSLQQDTQARIKALLCESLMYPADAEWLAEQLDDIYAELHRINQTSSINVKHDNETITLQGEKESLCLEWRAFWQETGTHNQSADALARRLSQMSCHV